MITNLDCVLVTSGLFSWTKFHNAWLEKSKDAQRKCNSKKDINSRIPLSQSIVKESKVRARISPNLGIVSFSGAILYACVFLRVYDWIISSSWLRTKSKFIYRMKGLSQAMVRYSLLKIGSPTFHCQGLLQLYVFGGLIQSLFCLATKCSLQNKTIYITQTRRKISSQ